MKKIAVGDLGEFWYGDYKEPFEQLEGAIPGYPQGALLKADDQRLLCPYCGKTFDNLGAHAAKIHGLPARQFKDEVGLLRGSALVSERTRMLNSAHAIRLRAIGSLRTPPPESWGKGAKAGGLLGGRGTRTPESLNKTGRCYAQIIATARSVQREYGRVSGARMRAHGITERAVTPYFGSWSNFLRAIGDSTKRSGITWSDTQLITALRSVAQEIGHTPTVSDQKRYGLPVRATFEHHFGNWSEACRRAGIEPNVPSEWARRAVTDQEELAILSGYAMSGRIDRAAKVASISADRARSILATFGIRPLPQESPLRREQQAVAARIARSLAGWSDPKKAA